MSPCGPQNKSEYCIHRGFNNDNEHQPRMCPSRPKNKSEYCIDRMFHNYNAHQPSMFSHRPQKSEYCIQNFTEGVIIIMNTSLGCALTDPRTRVSIVFTEDFIIIVNISLGCVNFISQFVT